MTTNNHGFTLAEVLIAIAILSVGAFGLLAVCYSSLRHEQEMLTRDDWQKAADYACATFRQHCAQNPAFLDDLDEDDEESAPTKTFPLGDDPGAYPPDARWAWRVTAAPDDTLPGLYRVTVRVFDMRERRADETAAADEAVFTQETFYARRQ